MPSRHIYISEEDVPVWDEAKKFGPVSGVIVEALKEYINSRKGHSKSTIEIKIDDKVYKFKGEPIE